jgi:hypothetical protein
MKAWMGGRKRKFGVERHSQAVQQRQFFAQRRRRNEKLAATGAGGSALNPAFNPRPMSRPPAELKAGRDVVALNPSRKAASGIIQMHSVQDPIHDFSDLGDIKMQDSSTTRYEPPMGECLRPSAFLDVDPASKSNDDHRQEYLQDKFARYPGMASPFKQVETTRGALSESYFRSNSLEMHSADSNLKANRLVRVVPQHEAAPLASTDGQRKLNASRRLMSSSGQDAHDAMALREIDQVDSDVGSVSKEIAKATLPPFNDGDPFSTLDDPMFRERDHVSRADPSVIYPKIELDGFNACIVNFEEGLLAQPEENIRIFSRRPEMMLEGKVEDGSISYQMLVESESGSALTQKVQDAIGEPIIHGDHSDITPLQANLLAVNTNCNLGHTYGSSFQDMPGIPFYTPVVNPISAATKVASTFSRKPMVIVRGVPVSINPVSPMLPSIDEILQKENDKSVPLHSLQLALDPALPGQQSQ